MSFQKTKDSCLRDSIHYAYGSHDAASALVQCTRRRLRETKFCFNSSTLAYWTLMTYLHWRAVANYHPFDCNQASPA